MGGRVTVWEDAKVPEITVVMVAQQCSVFSATELHAETGQTGKL